MNLRTFLKDKPVAERELFAESAGTTQGAMRNIAYGKSVDLGLADAIVALSGGAVALDDLPLTTKAQHQRAVRESATVKRRPRSANFVPA